MKKTILILLAALLILSVAGCGGGDGGVLPNPTPPVNQTSNLNGYVYAPGLATMSASQEEPGEGFLILDDPNQAPEDYDPVPDCLLELPDGTFTETDDTGFFNFENLFPSDDPDGIQLLLDPSNSPGYFDFLPFIMEIIIPFGDEPVNFNEIFVKPENLVLPVGGFYLYHVYGFTTDGLAFEVPFDQVEWFVNSAEGNIGSITPFGLFEATGEGTGKVLAVVQTQGGEKTAEGTIAVVPEGPAASIKGQVYSITPEGGKVGIPGAELYLSTLDPFFSSPGGGTVGPPNGVEENIPASFPDPGNYFDIGTFTDEEGNYEFPRVPAGSDLMLTVFNPRTGAVQMIENINLLEGETKVIDIELAGGTGDDYFEGPGTATYDPLLEGGAFILEAYPQTWAIPVEGPVIGLQNSEPGSPGDGGTFPIDMERYVLFGLENFPEARDKLMNDPGKPFEVFISGDINKDPNVYGLTAIVVDSIEIIVPTFNGVVTYDPALNGGTYVFTPFWAMPLPEPLPGEPVPVAAPDFMPEPVSFVLLGMENFPDVANTVQAAPGEDFEVFLTGEANYDANVVDMPTIQVETIEFMPVPIPL